MFDAGLLATGLAMVLIVHLAARWAPVIGRDRRDVVGRLYVPVLGGILAGRAVAAVLDDPTSLGSLRAFLVVRGGVEFWPGVAVAVGVFAVGALRRHERPTALLADLAPFVVWGYAVYEAACVVRDGCYGPHSAIGLSPAGLSATMFPVGWVVAATMVGLGFVLRRPGPWSAGQRILLAVGGVALARSIASVWLPRLTETMTRQHTESLAVLVMVIAVALAGHLTARWRNHEPVETAAEAL